MQRHSRLPLKGGIIQPKSQTKSILGRLAVSRLIFSGVAWSVCMGLWKNCTVDASKHSLWWVRPRRHTEEHAAVAAE